MRSIKKCENKTDSQKAVTSKRKRMAAEQNTMQTITQAAIETTTAVIMAVKEVENPAHVARSVHIMPRTGTQAVKKPTFN